MKKHLKWIIPVICVVLAVSLTGGYMYWRFIRVPEKMPTKIEYVHSDLMYNPDDPREVVGSQRYVFVGYVEETYDYYMTRNERKYPELIKEYDYPFTECVVKVVKNIKGNLKEGETFSFYKGGGVTKDFQAISLERNDLIPETGKYYVFTGYAHEEGTVTGGGQNGTIELEAGITEANLTDSAVYQTYLDAFKNQIIPGLDDTYPYYLAKNDVNYGDGSYNKQLKEEDLKEQAEIDAKYAAEAAAS